MDYTNSYLQFQSEGQATQFTWSTNSSPQADVGAPPAHPTAIESTSDAAYMVPLTRRRADTLQTPRPQVTPGIVDDFSTWDYVDNLEEVIEDTQSPFIRDPQASSSTYLLSQWSSSRLHEAYMGPRPSRMADDFDPYRLQGTLDGVQYNGNMENHASVIEDAPWSDVNSFLLPMPSLEGVVTQFSSQLESNISFTSGTPSAGLSRTADDSDSYRRQETLDGVEQYSGNMENHASVIEDAPWSDLNSFLPLMPSQGFATQFSSQLEPNIPFTSETPSAPFDPASLPERGHNSPTGGLFLTQDIERVGHAYVKFFPADPADNIISRFPEIFWPKDVPLPDNDEGAEDVEWVVGTDNDSGSREVPTRRQPEAARKHFYSHRVIAELLPSYPEEGVVIIVREDKLSDGGTECQVVFFDPQRAPVLLRWHVSILPACRPRNRNEGAASPFQCIYLCPKSGKLCSKRLKDLVGFNRHLDIHAAQERFDIEEEKYSKSQAILLKDDEFATARFWFCGICRHVGKSPRYSSFERHTESGTHITHKANTNREYYETRTKWKEAGMPRS